MDDIYLVSKQCSLYCWTEAEFLLVIPVVRIILDECVPLTLCWLTSGVVGGYPVPIGWPETYFFRMLFL